MGKTEKTFTALLGKMCHLLFFQAAQKQSLSVRCETHVQTHTCSFWWDLNFYIPGEYFYQQVSVHFSVNCSQSLFLTPTLFTEKCNIYCIRKGKRTILQLIDSLFAKPSFQSVPQLRCIFCKWNSRRDHERQHACNFSMKSLDKKKLQKNLWLKTARKHCLFLIFLKYFFF